MSMTYTKSQATTRANSMGRTQEYSNIVGEILS